MRGFVVGLVGLAGLAAVPGVAQAQGWRGYPDEYGYGYRRDYARHEYARHEYARPLFAQPVFAPYREYYEFPRRRAYYPVPEVVFEPPPVVFEPPPLLVEPRPVLRTPAVRAPVVRRAVVHVRPVARATCTCPQPISVRAPVIPETPRLPALRPAPEHEVYPPESSQY